MGLELATVEDIRLFKYEIIKAFKDEMKALNEKLEATKPDTILNSNQIMSELKLSASTFNRKLTELCDAGMFKDGQWKMRSSDLEKYINSKQNS